MANYTLYDITNTLIYPREIISSSDMEIVVQHMLDELGYITNTPELAKLLAGQSRQDLEDNWWLNMMDGDKVLSSALAQVTVHIKGELMTYDIAILKDGEHRATYRVAQK